MEVKVDAVGRILLPKALRESIGLRPGSTVDISFYGAGLQVTPGGRTARIVDEDGDPVAQSTTTFGDEEMYGLIDAMRR